MHIAGRCLRVRKWRRGVPAHERTVDIHEFKLNRLTNGNFTESELHGRRLYKDSIPNLRPFNMRLTYSQTPLKHAPCLSPFQPVFELPVGMGVEPPTSPCRPPTSGQNSTPGGSSFNPHLSFAEVGILLDSHFLLMQFLKYQGLHHDDLNVTTS